PGCAPCFSRARRLQPWRARISASEAQSDRAWSSLVFWPRALPAPMGADQSRLVTQSPPQPPHARDLAARRANPRNRIGNGFECYGHVEGIGMKQPRFIAYNADVALPEHEIAAPQAGDRGGGRERLPHCMLLHVAVAGAGYAAGRERDLQEAR